jgi:hypothetical protein
MSVLFLRAAKRTPEPTATGAINSRVHLRRANAGHITTTHVFTHQEPILSLSSSRASICTLRSVPKDVPCCIPQAAKAASFVIAIVITTAIIIVIMYPPIVSTKVPLQTLALTCHHHNQPRPRGSTSQCSEMTAEGAQQPPHATGAPTHLNT